MLDRCSGRPVFLVSLCGVSLFIGWVLGFQTAARRYAPVRSAAATPSPPLPLNPYGQPIKPLPEFTALTDEDLAQCLRSWGKEHHDTGPPPEDCPKDIPQTMYNEMTQNGTIPVLLDYACQCQTGSTAKKRTDYTEDLVNLYLQRTNDREADRYGHTDSWLYDAIDLFPVYGKDVVIMGSQTPWYESVCISNSAGRCTTLDFQAINSTHPLLHTMTLAEYDKNPKQFDIAISISSFEHDGLGRYGDPLRPNGDIDAMKKMKCLVKPDGYLFLSVPVGTDKVQSLS
eukprot:TRINITY_DN662_c0_g1_i1.p1 TRINITY_DN662_c0_g1~~TRINITY_DN662_c0_g1_i1.p1  ORF type:complete len:285 (+),score=10.20 TRINITY_DN662_c0_g1_i1:25-879(+)